MRIKKICGVLALTLVIAGGTGTVVAAGATAEDAEKAIVAAEEARKMAASVSGEWRDTGKMIKQAQAAQKAGEYGKAIELAGQAREQGMLGYEQAVSQKTRLMPSYLK